MGATGKTGFRFYVLGFIFLISAFFAVDFYLKWRKPKTPANLSNNFLEIPTGSSYNDLLLILEKEGFVLKPQDFDALAEKKGFKGGEIRNGRFELEPNMNYASIIDHLQNGKQAPVKLTMHSKRTPKALAAHVSQFIEADSAAIIEAMQDSIFLANLGYDSESIFSVMLANTYELFWNISPEGFIKRMIKESDKYWNEERKVRAKKIGLLPREVVVMASIIEKETIKDDEKTRMAGVYLNRLKENWRMDADPCVIYAWQDFSIRKLEKEHLEIDSPYNTYKYKGLPPGPICMPQLISIEKVLDAEEHDYMFFVAKADASGYHVYAKTLEGHKQNVRKYRAAIQNR